MHLFSMASLPGCSYQLNLKSLIWIGYLPTLIHLTDSLDFDNLRFMIKQHFLTGLTAFFQFYKTLQTVSFDWFLSGLECVLNLEFCLQKFRYFTRNYYGISDLGLSLPHFEFLGLYISRYIWSKSTLFVQQASILIKHI